MVEIKRVNSTDTDFIALVRLLDKELAERDGNDHSFYAQYNKIDLIRYCLVLYENKTPVSCGAIKELSSESTEVKRMYTLTGFRGKGYAQMILTELEKWAQELGYKNCVLETGKRQPEAIALYKKCGYEIISNYGQYIGIENSVCFQKKIIHLHA